MSRNLKIKTGFAATSADTLSLGETRDVLFNLLLAHRYRRPFQLRFDDELSPHQTKVDGLQPDANVLEDLRWLGIRWDEGPEVGGDHAPYYRSRRSSIYAAFYVKLIDMGLAFPCFCTEKALAVVREAQIASGISPHYAGGCNRLNSMGRQKKINQGLRAVLRFQAPRGSTCVYDDLVLGPQLCNADEVGAFVIRGHDGVARRQFTRAIDDALGGITHQFRSFREKSQLPAQILLLNALGLPFPAYGHLPDLVADKAAPSGVTLGSLRQAGYQPQAVLNWLARLGHRYESMDVLTLDALAADFHLSRLSHDPVVFTLSELDFWQARTVAGTQQVL